MCQRGFFPSERARLPAVVKRSQKVPKSKVDVDVAFIILADLDKILGVRSI